jgi:hypothetical protein
MVQHALADDGIEGRVRLVDPPHVPDSELAPLGHACIGGFRTRDAEHCLGVVDPHHLQPAFRRGDAGDAGPAPEVEDARTGFVLRDAVEEREERVCVVRRESPCHVVVVRRRRGAVEVDIASGVVVCPVDRRTVSRNVGSVRFVSSGW